MYKNKNVLIYIMLQILYGFYGNTTDVTDICLSQLSQLNDCGVVIKIPHGDCNRDKYFPSFLTDIEKSIFIITDCIVREYNQNYIIEINTTYNTISSRVPLEISYGISGNTTDVTDICLSQLKNDDVITIPCGNFNREVYFPSFLNGVEKSVFVLTENGICEFGSQYVVRINLPQSKIKITTACILPSLWKNL